MRAQGQITITAIYDGEDAPLLTVTSSAGLLAKNRELSTTLTAHVYSGGRELTAAEIDEWGAVHWYRDGAPNWSHEGISMETTVGGAETWEARLETANEVLSGDTVSFEGTEGQTVQELQIELEMTQDLHGYDGPWIGGSGKNRYDPETAPFEQGAVNGNTGQNYGASSAYNANRLRTDGLIDAEAGMSYTLSANLPYAYLLYYGAEGLTDYLGNSGAWADTPYTFTPPEGAAKLRVMLAKGTAASGASAVAVTPGDFEWMQIEEGETATAWEPYENICPVAGHDGVSIRVAQTGAEDAVYPVAFASSVYGGTLDPIRGTLTADRVRVRLKDLTWSRITSYAHVLYRASVADRKYGAGNDRFYASSHYGIYRTSATLAGLGNNLPDKRIGFQVTTVHMVCRDDDCTSAADFKASIPEDAEIVVPLEEPIVYQLTPVQIAQLAGSNTVSLSDGTIARLVPGYSTRLRGALGLGSISDARYVLAVENWYLVSNSDSGVTQDTPGWTQDPGELTLGTGQKWLWNYEAITYSDANGVPEYSFPALIGGISGETRGIDTVEELYQVKASRTEEPETWKPLPPMMTKAQPYLWNKEILHFDDGGTLSFGARVIGAMRIDGFDGIEGAGGEYLHVKYSNDGGESFTGMSGEEIGSWIGTYVDNDPRDSDDPADYSWRKFSDPVVAGMIEESEDKIYEELRGSYVAKSDFGTYTRDTQAIIEANSRGVQEIYNMQESIQSAVGANGQALESYMTELNGEIRRGFILDPDTGDYVIGIAVSQNLNFTGAVRTEDGTEYYELSQQGAFGLYTATGWQYWINGRKMGWFSSEDSQLHVRSIVSESEVLLGTGWKISHAGGFGIKRA